MAKKTRQRYFLEDGTEVPGVTTILSVINKPALVAWANKMGLQGIDTNRHVDELATIGTLAHSLIQAHLSKVAPDLRDYSPNQVGLAENACLSYFEWEKHRQMETILAEQPLVSELGHFGGTPDWYGALDGRRVLLDFKTSRGIYDDHLYQLSAYWHLLREKGHVVDECRILRVGREPNEGFEERTVSDDSMQPYFDVFSAALSLHQAMKGARR